ncbi:hypothetical protein ACFX13_012264 [Malus domestica]|uniref:zinc finger BED domain-containing protein DAYSLEEPER-like n=1 Tax=Malus domestica TaxID=3750 RepID=UPI0010A9ADC4|nr:zinc finger BED domain-containing protein DAYSLEEPER-like [Malus domestica]
MGTKEILKKFDGQISLSVDIMMNEKNFDRYLCLSAHFVDEKWELKKQQVYFRSLEDTNDLLPEDEDWGIFSSLKKWGIEDKVSTLTMTNDGVYDELAGFVKGRIQEKKELQLDGQLFRVYCCGKLIGEMVNGAFQKIQDIINKVDPLYPVANLPLWYLTSSKLKEALELWSKGEFSSVDETFYEVPSAEEWKKVEGVCKVLESVYMVSNALFETKDLTANVYLYRLDELRDVLTQMHNDSDSFTRKIAEGMLSKLDKYVNNMFLHLAIAAVLDPRLKMQFVDTVWSKVKGAEGGSRVAAVSEAIHKLFDKYSLDVQMNNHPSVGSDLDLYLGEAVVPWSQSCTALAWWKTAAARYPTLSKMARDFLAIPFSIATSYEAFYIEPRPAKKNLVGLEPGLANALLFARSRLV